MSVTYSCVEGGHEGDGNIDAAPLFVDAPSANLRLSAGSPCIDAGDSTAVLRDFGDADQDGCTTDWLPDLDGNDRFHDDLNSADTGVPLWMKPVVDMGAYEFGSMPVAFPNLCPGDLNCDSIVNAYDIDGFICALSPACDYENLYPECDAINGDCNEDGAVDAYDIDGFIALVGGG